MNTVDIISIHDAIVQDFKNDDKKKNLEVKKWEKLYSEIENNSSFTILEDIQNKIKDTNEKQTNNFNYYITEALPVIELYENKKKLTQKVCFFSSVSEENEKNKDMEQIINKYLSIVTTYFPKKYDCRWQYKIENSKKDVLKKNKVEKQTKCKICDASENDFVLVDNQIICSTCGTVLTTQNDNIISFRDIERVNIGSKYSYDRRVHFRECLKRFQGKQNINIDNVVFKKLTQHFLQYQLIPENYKEIPRKEAFQKVKREHIHLFLKELGYSRYYEDIVYIFHYMTEQDIPDISHLENNLLLDFDLLVDMYDKMFKNDRKNFINNQYVLYQLLRKYKYPCRKEDFNFLKTNDRKLYHDSVCQKLFEKLGWNFQPVF